MSHYFDRESAVESRPFDYRFTINGKDFFFRSDQGVFSKDELDTGSEGLLLEVLKEPRLNGRLLDLGCGIGTLGLVLASFFPSLEVHLTDVSLRAIELAKINAERLSLGSAKIYYSDIFSAIHDTFDTIVCNPPIRAGKQVIYQMFAESYQHLAPLGTFWIVIRKSHGAESARKKLIEIFGNCEIMRRHQGHYILKSEMQSNLVEILPQK